MKCNIFLHIFQRFVSKGYAIRWRYRDETIRKCVTLERFFYSIVVGHSSCFLKPKTNPVFEKLLRQPLTTYPVLLQYIHMYDLFIKFVMI